jgi:hypothetical protein
MATAHSTRRRARRHRRPHNSPAADSPDFPALLGHFRDALALLETVARALGAAEEDEVAEGQRVSACIGAHVVALNLSVAKFREVYTDWDRALLALTVS